jgi:hypothetical protein
MKFEKIQIHTTRIVKMQDIFYKRSVEDSTIYCTVNLGLLLPIIIHIGHT